MGSNENRMKIGIMGGTFNPVHLGHLLLAEHAREELGLDEVWFVPTGCSYMKEQQLKHGTGMPSAQERFFMTELAIGGIPGYRCLDLEIRRTGNTYSYETLETLKNTCQDKDFFFIFGADCLYSIDSWKEPGRIFNACHVVAAVRENASMEKMEETRQYLTAKYQAKITLLPFRNLEISSTEIRKRVSVGKSIRFMVPQEVEKYILEKGFYRDENN